MTEKPDLVTGVSCVLCCYNSARRLPATLEYLARQHLTADINWEVIVVDNNSSDNTAQVSEDVWKKLSNIPIRVVTEARQGLNFARKRGFDTAKYNLVCFVDDDNWLDPNWIGQAYEIMSHDSTIGACGGHSSAVFEQEPPEWFVRWKGYYAIGSQARQTGFLDEGECLWGAGLCIRKDVWETLGTNGFDFRIADRCGKQLSSGGDVELVLAVKLCGWKLWYDDKLELQHFIPKERLTMEYLRKLVRSMGFGGPLSTPYYRVLNERSGRRVTLIDSIKGTVPVQILLSLLHICYCQLRILLLELRNPPISEKIELWTLYLELHLGRLNGIWKVRSLQEDSINDIKRLISRVENSRGH